MMNVLVRRSIKIIPPTTLNVFHRYVSYHSLCKHDILHVSFLIDMYNFIWGLQAVLREAKDTLMSVMDYPLFWGFAMGFLVSTIVHAFLMTDSPRQVPAVLFQDKSKELRKTLPATRRRVVRKVVYKFLSDGRQNKAGVVARCSPCHDTHLDSSYNKIAMRHGKRIPQLSPQQRAHCSYPCSRHI